MSSHTSSQLGSSDGTPANTIPVRRALVSVSDKSGLLPLAKALAAAGTEIISTGGTARSLIEDGIAITPVDSVTGFPEIMDGRVKTLHPKIHGGLLGDRSNPDHRNAMELHDIGPIDLVVVNLYPFEQTVGSAVDRSVKVENIDIGGPAMIRAAAKNADHVAIIVDPADYDLVQTEIANAGGTSLALRRRLAAKAFARTAAYDAAIAHWLQEENGDVWPERLTFTATLGSALRYGENPHQSAALYLTGDKRPSIATAKQVQGKPLSFNNINDANAAFALIGEFDPASSSAAAIIKHANPCGVACGSSLVDAYKKALAADPVSAFGGIIAVNQKLDAEAAEAITELFTEVVIAPEADEPAQMIFAAKKNLRLLLTGGLPDPASASRDIRSVAGGFLVQTGDNGCIDGSDLTVVTDRTPTDQEFADMLFAFKVAKHVKSNAIVYALKQAIVGIGAGQMSRVDSVRIAAWKAEDAAKAAGLSEPMTRGSVVASDAFFPFADGLMAAAEAGATAIIQPGGSKRDDEVIAAANEAGLAMVFTGMRHFRH